MAVSDCMPPNGAAGSALAWGDCRSAYIVAQRADMAIRLDGETYADTDQTLLVLWARFAAPINVDAYRVGTLSG